MTDQPSGSAIHLAAVIIQATGGDPKRTLEAAVHIDLLLDRKIREERERRAGDEHGRTS